MKMMTIFTTMKIIKVIASNSLETGVGVEASKAINLKNVTY